MRWSLRPTRAERSASLAGDQIVPRPHVVMDRAFDLPAPPERVWPWVVQLGKRRGGWYLPASIERAVPPARRALRRVDPTLQDLRAGQVIPDWGGREESFEVAIVDPERALVHRSRRGRSDLSWAIVLTPNGDATRMHLRLRMAPVRHRLLARTGGELVDWLTVAGLAAGLRERVQAR